MIRQMDMEYTLIWMDRDIKDNGYTTSSKVKEYKLGLMVQSIKDNI